VHSAFGPYPGQTLGDAFICAVEHAGGVPLILPSCDPSLAAAQAAVVDGLVLSGGSDVAAHHYDTDPHPTMEWVDPQRDAWELALLAAAQTRGIAVLGVCRGSQLINVARGGTLHQHVADLGGLVHEQDSAHRHGVTVQDGTLLHTILAGGRFSVTSLHHQGLDRIGDGLVVAARADDGLAEAVEDRPRRTVGVAWHPEVQLDEPAGQRLFDWVVRESRRDV
jgi:putative glutamine amidotransferase